MAVAI